MESLVILGPTDIGLVLSDFTLTVNTLAEPPVPVDTTGATMPEYSDGLYNLIVPGATMNSKWTLTHNTNPLIAAEGFFIDSRAVVKELAPEALATLLPYNGAMMWDNRKVPTSIEWEAEDGISPLPADASINIYSRPRSHLGNTFLAFFENGAWTFDPNAEMPRPSFGMMAMEITTAATPVPAGTFHLKADDYEQVFDVPYTPANMNDLATHILADGTLVPHQVDSAKKKHLLSQESKYARAALLTGGRAQCGDWAGLQYVTAQPALPLDFSFQLESVVLDRNSGWNRIAYKDAGDASIYIDTAFPTPAMSVLYLSYTTGATALAETTYLRIMPTLPFYDQSAHSRVAIIPPTPANTYVLAWVLDTGYLMPYRNNNVPPVTTSQGATPQQIMSDYKDPATGYSAMDYMRNTEKRRPGLLFVSSIENGCYDFVETPQLPLNAGMNAKLWLVSPDHSIPDVQIAERGADNGVWTSMPAPSGATGFLRFDFPSSVPYPATLLEFKTRGNAGTSKFTLRLPDNSLSAVTPSPLFFNADGTPHNDEGAALGMTPPAEAALAPTDVQNIADTVAAAVGDEVADGTWRTLVPGIFPLGSAGSEMGQLRDITTKFVEAIGQLLAHTYTAGEVHSPFAALPAPTVPMYYKTNYVGTTKVGEAWGAILSTPGVKVFYTTKLRSEDKTPTIDAECAILDPVKGTIQIALTKEQLTVKTGEYFSQLQARTYTTDLVPVVDQIWIMQEGKQLVKPTFKG